MDFSNQSSSSATSAATADQSKRINYGGAASWPFGEVLTGARPAPAAGLPSWAQGLALVALLGAAWAIYRKVK